MFKIVLSLIVLFGIIQASLYQGHKVVSLRLTKDNIDSFFDHFPRDSIDIWSNDQRVEIDQDVEIMLSPSQYQTLFGLKNIFSFAVSIEDVQKLIDQEQEQVQMEEARLKSLSKQQQEEYFYSEQYYQNYHNYETILKYVQGFKDKFPQMVDTFELGKTVENRTIHGFRFHAPGAYNPRKKGLWINSLQHAREWVTAPTTQYTIWQLLEGYSRNPKIKVLMDMFNIHYVPVLNVDGFIYTHTNARLWRKNRRGGYGVDLNRNWKAGWGSGSSDNRNSEVYRGPSALSEPETQAVDRYLKQHTNEINYGIDFHAYSEVVLRPYGRTRDPCRDEDKLREIGQKMVQAIEKVNRKLYNNWRAVQLGLGNGLDDEFYDSHKFKGGFCTELRPRSSFGGGFVLPPREILPCAKENFEGVIELLTIMSNGNFTN